MSKLKTILLIITTTALVVCGAIIAVAVWEVILDLNKGSYKLIVLCILCGSNAMIFITILYFLVIIIRNTQYSWYVSCHYFSYVVLEIISGVLIFDKFDYLEFPIVLAVLVLVLFVLLFFVTCFTERNFRRMEEEIAEKEDERKYRSLSSYSARKKKLRCVFISLYPAGVNRGAGTSRVSATSSKASTASQVTKK